MHREYIEIDIDEVVLKESIREESGDIGTLTASVSRLGLLMPILIDRNNIMITGSRRIAACRSAGIRHIPAIRLDTDYDSMTALEIQVDMNLCQQPLTSHEVEGLIGKKRLAVGRRGGATGGVLGRMKQFFGND